MSNPKTPRLFANTPPSLRVALCQVYTEEWALEENLGRTVAALREAADHGAELAITPECVLHGYGSEVVPDYRTRILEAAEPLDGPRLRTLRNCAKEAGIACIAGFAERAGDRVHNSAAFLSPEGEILSVYRKIHCRPFEDVRYQGMFTPGEEFTVTPFARNGSTFSIGTMICFDREIPESVRCLRALGAQFIACPLATDTSDMGRFVDFAENEMVTRCRAAENEVFIAVVNHAGRYNGGSFLVGPGGELLHQMGPDAGVAVLDVPIGVVGRDFHSQPLGWMGWGYRRPEVYRKYLL